jgi:hypothetical protein
VDTIVFGLSGHFKVERPAAYPLGVGMATEAAEVQSFPVPPSAFDSKILGPSDC